MPLPERKAAIVSAFPPTFKLMARDAHQEQVPVVPTLRPEGILFAEGVRESEALQPDTRRILEEKGQMETVPRPKTISYPERTLLVVGGVPAVGKTTMIKRLLPEECQINLDQFITFTDNGSAAGFRYKEFLAEIERTLGERGRAVVHMTALRYAIRNGVGQLAAHHNAEAHLLMLDGDREMCAAGQDARAAERSRIPDDVMESYLQNWEHFKFLLRCNDIEDACPHYRSALVLDRNAVDSLERIGFTS